MQPPQRGHIPFIPRAKKTLELSLREAIALGNNFIGSEHILLGLIREGDNPATQVLNGLGVNPDRVPSQAGPRVSVMRVVEEPQTGALPRGPKRKLVSELHGRLDSLERRLSVLQERAGPGPEMRDLEREVAQVRRDKEAAIDVQNFEGAAVLLQGEPVAQRQGRPGTGVGSPSVVERGDRAASRSSPSARHRPAGRRGIAER